MGVSGGGPAPLHPTQGLSSAASRRGQAAPPAASDRPAAPPLGLQAGASAPAPGGMAREPQAGTAPVARGGPQTPGSVPQAPPTTARQQRAAPRRATEPRVGPGLSVRRDRRRSATEAVERRRRVHPRGPGHARGSALRRGRPRRGDRGSGRRARRAEMVAYGQRARAHCLGAARLVSLGRH
jgi:hypothetical protein